MHPLNIQTRRSVPFLPKQTTCRSRGVRVSFCALTGFLSVLFGGCATNVHLTYDGHPSGAAVEVRKVAVDTYLYAQLAQNAYAEDEFKLPSFVTELEPRDTPGTDDRKTGFAVRTYWVRPPGRKPYVVVAFRGTQFTSFEDWKNGNFSDTQYKQGLAHVQRIRKKVGPEPQIVVTGHSLGGAIATSVSLNEENTEAYGFDASLRLTRGRGLTNWREYVSQHGEILAAVRKVFRNPYGRYTMINCPGLKGRPSERHNMRGLAACLTRIAASDGDKTAEWSRRENGLGPTEAILKSPNQPINTSEQWRN